MSGLKSVGMPVPREGTMKAGHYKGAKNIPSGQLVDKLTNCLKSPQELQQSS